MIDLPQWGSRLKSNREGSPRTLCPQRALYVQVRTYMLERMIVLEQWCSSGVYKLNCYASWVIHTPDPLTASLHLCISACYPPYNPACMPICTHTSQSNSAIILRTKLPTPYPPHMTQSAHTQLLSLSSNNLSDITSINYVNFFWSIWMALILSRLQTLDTGKNYPPIIS